MTLTTRSPELDTSASPSSCSVPQFALLALHPAEAPGWRLVGRYLGFEEAVAARIDDGLTQLEANDGWLVTVDHLIVGPDLDGSVGAWPQTSCLGAHPSSDRIPDPYDRDSWREWLEQTHRMTR
jgi:hypothetical protein